MKKLITVILIIVLAMHGMAYADNIDKRIVGYWYFFVDGDFYPEYMQNFGDYDYSLIAYFFSKDGFVFLLENDMKDNVATPTFISCGKWKKIGLDKYSAQIMGFGDCEIIVEDNKNMYLTSQQVNNVKMHLRGIFPFDPYSDYSY